MLELLGLLTGIIVLILWYLIWYIALPALGLILIPFIFIELSESLFGTNKPGIIISTIIFSGFIIFAIMCLIKLLSVITIGFFGWFFILLILGAIIPTASYEIIIIFFV